MCSTEGVVCHKGAELSGVASGYLTIGTIWGPGDLIDQDMCSPVNPPALFILSSDLFVDANE